MLARWIEMIDSINPWLIGFAGSVVVAGAALWKCALTRSGAAAAVAMGTIYYGSGDLVWFGLLLAFFITSTFWSKWKKRKKSHLDHIYEKTGERDAGQVFANGGIGMLLCMANAVWPSSVWLWLFIGVMATVNADTWATEIGSLSKRLPRSLLNGKQVAAGTSGAISLLGTFASVAGALTIGLAAAGLMVLQGLSGTLPAGDGLGWITLLIVIAAAAIGGTVGALFDSLLGATVQAGYQCKICGISTERLSHCEAATNHIRGLVWLNNDRVNLLASCTGAIVSLLVALLL
ncbi:conserved membrane protein of unknown function [Paenibacillus alvei]|uniref:DUF92 domain-containing protein n=2 Tax=Paenibacillus alvei TaxID=44250 RepID=A0A383RF31_PAEAL|nr:conserved membrane protein of unknown function [Paenibacillus alvei]